MKGGGGGFIEVLKVAIHASVFTEKKIQISCRCNGWSYCWPHRKQELKLH